MWFSCYDAILGDATGRKVKVLNITLKLPQWIRHMTIIFWITSCLVEFALGPIHLQQTLNKTRLKMFVLLTHCSQGFLTKVSLNSSFSHSTNQKNDQFKTTIQKCYIAATLLGIQCYINQAMTDIWIYIWTDKNGLNWQRKNGKCGTN